MSRAALLPRLIGQRRSLTRQISLVFALISFCVIAAIGFAIDNMLSHELFQENNILLLGNVAIMRDRLARADNADALLRDPRLTQAIEMAYNKLHVAVFDADRRLLQASEGFNVPAAMLPEVPIPAETIPRRVDNPAERQLRVQHGKLSRQWVDGDGRSYQFLLASMNLAGARAGATPRKVLVAMSYDRTIPGELLSRYRAGLLETLLLSVLASAALGVWAAHLVLKRARRLAGTASRISAHALGERLPLEDTPEELVESTTAFNHMLDRLEQSFRRLSEFSADLAHDMRTPINNLLGEAQVALSRPREAAEYRAVLESAVEEYERLSRMIENMLFLARADNAQAQLKPHWIGLDAALGNILSYYELLAEERDVHLELSVDTGPGGPLQVWADELMLGRAVGNLLSNALRHSPAGSTVTVRATHRDGGGASIEVSNPGAGIPAEHLPRIFDRFYRGSSAREDSAGSSGLGLAIVKSIMELHGGRALAQSKPGTHTVFTLSFPALH